MAQEANETNKASPPALVNFINNSVKTNSNPKKSNPSPDYSSSITAKDAETPVLSSETQNEQEQNNTSSLDKSADDTPTGWRPVFTGYGTYGTSFEPGAKHFNFSLNPIFLVPVGKTGLISMEWEMAWDITRADSNTNKNFEHGLEYLQYNQPVSKYFTAVFGKFLLPGMFVERLHPAWIKKTMEMPYTMELMPESGTGFMLRGTIPIGDSVNLTYSPFFTNQIANKYFGSERMVGGRVGAFIKTKALDFGFLFARSLSNVRTNIYGVDGTYQLKSLALDIRSEYYRHQDQGSAYWIEIAKRWKEAPIKRLRKLEFASRFEQAFAKMPISEEMGGDEGEQAGAHEEGFPSRNMNRLIGTVNYYLNDGMKIYCSYGREMIPGTGTSKNSWGFGLSYRWLK